jgi:hypothetical protein
MSNLSQFAFSPLGTSFRGCVCPRTSSLPTTSTCACANYTIQTTGCDSRTNLGRLIRLCKIARQILCCNYVAHCSFSDVHIIYAFQNRICALVAACHILTDVHIIFIFMHICKAHKQDDSHHMDFHESSYCGYLLKFASHYYQAKVTDTLHDDLCPLTVPHCCRSLYTRHTVFSVRCKVRPEKQLTI